MGRKRHGIAESSMDTVDTLRRVYFAQEINEAFDPLDTTEPPVQVTTQSQLPAVVADLRTEFVNGSNVTARQLDKMIDDVMKAHMSRGAIVVRRSTATELQKVPEYWGIVVHVRQYPTPGVFKPLEVRWLNKVTSDLMMPEELFLISRGYGFTMDVVESQLAAQRQAAWHNK